MHLLKRRWILVTAVAFVLTVALIGSYGIYIAGSSGMLPWQPEPTRIAVTPFAGIPGFSEPAATPTVAPGA